MKEKTKAKKKAIKLLLLVSFISLISTIVFSDNGTYVPPNCGDGTCDYVIEDYKNCPADCENPCGNGQTNTGENCQNCPQDVKCSSGQTCIGGSCVSDCGNGVCGSGECSFCAKDCNVGTCSNNGRCDEELGENCQNSPADCVCPNDKQCNIQRGNSRGCYSPECGDNYQDPGETQENCCIDLGCPPNKKCFMNKCVDCMKDSDCGNKKCSPKSLTCVECAKDEDCEFGVCHPFKEVCVECYADAQCNMVTQWHDSFFCSPDFTKVMQRGIIFNGECNLETFECSGTELETSRDYASCINKGLYCQSEKCGCDEGYSASKELKQCVKIGNLGGNDPCSADFQCKSGYCGKSGKCINALNVVLSATELNLKAGEETTIRLSADNNLDKSVNANIAINIGSGAEMTDIISAMDCAGNQCKTSIKLSSRSREDVTIVLIGKKGARVPISAEVTYWVDNKEYTVNNIEDILLTYSQCGDKVCDNDESSQTCCIDCPCQNNTKYSYFTCNVKNNACKKNTDFPAVSKLAIILLIVMGAIFFAIGVGPRLYIGKFFSNIKHHVKTISTNKNTMKKNKLIAGLLALFGWPIAAGYIYLKKWNKFWVTIAVIWGSMIFFKGGFGNFIRWSYAFWTVYDCVQLAGGRKRTKSTEPKTEKEETITPQPQTKNETQKRLVCKKCGSSNVMSGYTHPKTGKTHIKCLNCHNSWRE